MADRNSTRTTTVRTCDLALTVTIICDEQKPPPPPPRRRLAPNVVCMFAADRPVVINERRRGRLPRNVSRFWIPPFAIGDVVEIFAGKGDLDNGVRVKIYNQSPNGGDFWIEAVSGSLHTINRDGSPNGTSPRAQCPPRHLRRIAKHSR